MFVPIKNIHDSEKMASHKGRGRSSKAGMKKRVEGRCGTDEMFSRQQDDVS